MVGHGTFEKEQKHFVGILHFRAVHHSHQYSLLPRVGFSKFFFRLTNKVIIEKSRGGMEKELRFGLDLGQLALLKKKLGQL